jgi:cyclase
LLRAAAVIGAFGAGGRILGEVLNAVGIDRVALLAEAGPLALPKLGHFDFAGVELTLPNRTFEGELELQVGDKKVVLIEVGPAHTRGDAVVWVPGDKTLFTGDILFKDAHPIIWQGPVSNWIAALQRLLAMDIETVVPGHGPLTDKSGLAEILHYLEVLTAETRRRHDAGMSMEDTVRDLTLDEFKDWLDAERTYVKLHTLYRDFVGDTEPGDVLALFAGMGRLQRSRR